MVEFFKSMSIITLCVNNLNILIKRQRKSDWTKMQDSLEAIYKKSTKYEDIDQLKVKR